MAIGATSEGPDRPSLAVRDPARGTTIEELAVDDAGAVRAAVERARAAQPAWAVLSVRERARRVKRARRELVRDRAAILGLLERRDRQGALRRRRRADGRLPGHRVPRPARAALAPSRAREHAAAARQARARRA